MTKQIQTEFKRRLLLLFAIHRNESGSISISSLFGLLLLVMVLGLVMNATRQIDRKVKMQNAADAATQSGGVVVTRNMNTLAFTNHLTADVFALTAFLREARDQKSARLVQDMIENWERVGPAFAGSEFPRFDLLGQAINESLPGERAMVESYALWSAAASEMILPVMEDILEQRRIPEFQRALVDATPIMMQYAANETARRHGRAWPTPEDLTVVVWRTDGQPVGGYAEVERRTLPVVDPVLDVAPNLEDYREVAVGQRFELSHRYLQDWINDSLAAFDQLGHMSRYSEVYRKIASENLEDLLNDEYPNTNLLFQIRHRPDQIETTWNDHLERDFMFVGVVYGDKINERIPGVFRNPSNFTTQSYAQISLFVPRRRLIKVYPGASVQGNSTIAGVPGQSVDLPGPPRVPPPPVDPVDPDEERPFFISRQSSAFFPEGWDLLTQNWTVQLCPATARNLPTILSTAPDVEELDDAVFNEIQPPDYRELTPGDMRYLSHH